MKAVNKQHILNTMVSGILRMCCLLLLPLIIFACSTEKPSLIDSQLIRQEGYEQIKDVLRIYVRPILDEKEVEKYFGANLLERNILPVFVLVENNNPTRFFLVEASDQDDQAYSIAPEKNGIKSKPENDIGVSSKEAKEMVYETERDRFLVSTGVLGGPIIFLAVLPFAVMSDFQYGPTDASKSLQQALITQSFEKQTLASGRTEQGFIYFQIPPDRPANRTIGILIKATDVESQEAMFLSSRRYQNQEKNDYKFFKRNWISGCDRHHHYFADVVWLRRIWWTL